MRESRATILTDWVADGSVAVHTNEMLLRVQSERVDFLQQTEH